MQTAESARTEGAPLSEAEIRLRRLWKGTLLVGVAAGYALLVALLLIQHGWRSALLALFFIVVAQFLRYIASDVDRVGWNLSRGYPAGGSAAPPPGQGAAAMRYQARLFRGLWALAQVANAGLLVQALYAGGADRALATAAGLAFIEVLFWQVRRVNHQVTFEQASYGMSDGQLGRPAPARLWDEAAKDRLQRRLDRLSAMAEAGEISAKAYRRARDKWLVRSVMAEDGDGR